jgi:hypothetical protein
MQQNAVLQKYLRRPFGVNGSKLLLGLDAVVIDAEKLPFSAPVSKVGEPGRMIRRIGSIRRHSGIGPGLKSIVSGSQAGLIGLCLLNGLLDQFVAFELTVP